MGDRAIVIFHATDAGGTTEFSPAAYLHWSGSHVPELLRELAQVMVGRDGDPSYACARFLAIACAKNPGNLSVGCMNGPTSMVDAKSSRYDHGDAGTFLVDCGKWSVKALNGYGKSIADLRAPAKAKAR